MPEILDKQQYGLKNGEHFFTRLINFVLPKILKNEDKKIIQENNSISMLGRPTIKYPSPKALFFTILVITNHPNTKAGYVV